MCEILTPLTRSTYVRFVCVIPVHFCETGQAIHPVELDHEDDDILDDLAQAVLTAGGEVIVAPKDQLPTTSPVLAILKSRPC